MLPTKLNVVSPKRFDELFSEEARIAEFASPDEEAAYEKRDSFLIHLIRREVESHFGPDEAKQPDVGDDWWPNHTRYIHIKIAHCTAAFLGALHSLLAEDFRDYRIQLVVYGDTLTGDAYIGSMALYVDRMVIEQRVYESIGSGTLDTD